MVEQTDTEVNITDYKSVFPTPASDDALAKAIVASQSFPYDHESDMLSAIQSTESPKTNNLWSLQDAKEQRNLVFSNVVTHIAGSKNIEGIYSPTRYGDEKFNPNFKRNVIKHLDNWSSSKDISQSEKEEIMKIKRRAEEAISGVLWGLYKNELSDFIDEYHFARVLFNNRDYTIRPDSINPERVNDIKRELNR
jgi:hypothetical protein